MDKSRLFRQLAKNIPCNRLAPEQKWKVKGLFIFQWQPAQATLQKSNFQVEEGLQKLLPRHFFQKAASHLLPYCPQEPKGQTGPHCKFFLLSWWLSFVSDQFQGHWVPYSAVRPSLLEPKVFLLLYKKSSP